jgi:hypothetical protein
VAIGLFTLAFHVTAVAVVVLMFWHYRGVTEAPPWQRPGDGDGGGSDRRPLPVPPWAWRVTGPSRRPGRHHPRQPDGRPSVRSR